MSARYVPKTAQPVLQKAKLDTRALHATRRLQLIRLLLVNAPALVLKLFLAEFVLRRALARVVSTTLATKPVRLALQHAQLVLSRLELVRHAKLPLR